ncbi:type VI secretion system tube protein Hcp [Caballeronia sp. LZ065]|uniref:Hcp family type VI secretion system effector n=1 Tax=Caballeronia sp. LZ065 TaxID=3038571 RepID=UPI002860463A|nr:type VI secretion system tube protein Hcp [Caballeronia sp. LZ065]MDR5783637.1 type VI secretion system tube protein Hcp [Caballeronia sp. LZ065]
MESNIFIRIDGVKGDATALGHEGEIDVISWTWAMSQPSRDTSKSRKASIDHITFVHGVGIGTNGLMSMLLNNVLAETAVLSFRRADAQAVPQGMSGKIIPPPDYLKITLRKVMVNAIEPFGSALGHFERVTLSFNEFKREYMTQTASGMPAGVACVQYVMGYA